MEQGFITRFLNKITNKFQWLQLIIILLIILLTLEVILLMIQNRELKSIIKSMSISGSTEMLNPGERAEPFKVKTMDGNIAEINFIDTTKRYLFFILSTNCPHCENNLISWQRIVNFNKDNNVDIVGISMNDVNQTNIYLASKEVSFYTVCSPESIFTIKYKIVGVPQTILINEHGIVEKVWPGELGEVEINNIIMLLNPREVIIH